MRKEICPYKMRSFTFNFFLKNCSLGTCSQKVKHWILVIKYPSCLKIILEDNPLRVPQGPCYNTVAFITYPCAQMSLLPGLLGLHTGACQQHPCGSEPVIVSYIKTAEKQGIFFLHCVENISLFSLTVVLFISQSGESGPAFYYSHTI